MTEKYRVVRSSFHLFQPMRGAQCFVEHWPYPCGCPGSCYEHSLGTGNAAQALYDSLCECDDCGAVWWWSDWTGREL